MPIAQLVYSAPDGAEHRCPVWPSEAELAAMAGGGDILMAWTADRSASGNLKAVWDGEDGIEKKSQYGENARRAG